MAIVLGPPPRVPLRGAACTLLALGLCVSPAAPASASPVHVVATSTVNWSGYALNGGGFTGVTGTFNVPAPLKSTSCLEETSVWVGIDGLHNRDLLQAGVAERGFTVPSSRTQTTWPAPGVAPVLCGARPKSLPGGKTCPLAQSRSASRCAWAIASRCPFSKCRRAGGPSPCTTSRRSRASFWPSVTAGPKPRWSGWSRLRMSWASRGALSRSARWSSTTSTPTVTRTACNASASAPDATWRPRRAWWQVWANSGAPASRSRGPCDQAGPSGMPVGVLWTKRRPCAPKTTAGTPGRAPELRRAPEWLFRGTGPRLQSQPNWRPSCDAPSAKPST